MAAQVVVALGTGKNVRDLTATVDQQRAEMDHVRAGMQRYEGSSLNSVPKIGVSSPDPALEDMS